MKQTIASFAFLLLSMAVSVQVSASEQVRIIGHRIGEQVREDDRKIPEKYLKDPQKPILVMFTASWCGPCQMMKVNTFRHPDVKPLLEQVNLLMMDIDTAEGKKYQTAFGKEKQGIPCLVLMDKEQRVVAESSGYSKDTKPFIEFLNKALKPQNQ